MSDRLTISATFAMLLMALYVALAPRLAQMPTRAIAPHGLTANIEAPAPSRGTGAGIFLAQG
jgi:hypothetical protein